MKKKRATKRELRAKKHSSESFSGFSDILRVCNLPHVSNALLLVDELASSGGEVVAALSASAMKLVGDDLSVSSGPLEAVWFFRSVYTETPLYHIAGMIWVHVDLVTDSLCAGDMVLYPCAILWMVFHIPTHFFFVLRSLVCLRKTQKAKKGQGVPLSLLLVCLCRRSIRRIALGLCEGVPPLPLECIEFR